MVKTDEQLYNEFLKGDKNSFEEIIKRHRIELIYFILNYTKDISSAEDVAQDTFVYILVNKERFNPTYKLKTYLYTIAKSRAINYINKAKKTCSLYENFNTEFGEEIIDIINLTDHIHKKEKLKQIEQVMKKLKPNYQTVIYLYEFEEMSISEISKILDKSLIQVKSLIYNAKKKLRKLLNEEGIFYDD